MAENTRAPTDMFDSYRKMLVIDKSRLDEELEIQAEVQQRIAIQVTDFNTAMLNAKEALKLTESEVAIQVRRASGDSRVTDKQVEAEVMRDSKRQQAFQKHQSLRDSHEHWSSLLEAWRQRGFSIKTLADLYSAQYFTIDTTYKNKLDTERRESMQAARERIDERRRAEGQPVVEHRPSSPNESSNEQRPRRRVVS